MAQTAVARVTEIVADDQELSTFDRLLRRSKVIAEVDTDEPFTIFAPVNDAFDRLPPGTMGRLMDDPGLLREVMSYHVASGMYSIEELRTERAVSAISGPEILVEPLDDGTYVGGWRVVTPDIQADNGFVHTLDGVMFPE